MRPAMRRYAGEEDYFKIRQFLVDVMIANELREFSWHLARLDYWRWHGILNCGDMGLENIFIWEVGGEIAAVLNPESKCHAFFQMHPKHCCTDLLGEMLAVAEKELADIGREGKRKLFIWVNSEDKIFQELLIQRGFRKFDKPEVNENQRRQDLEGEIPDMLIPEGYSIRSMRGMDDLPSRSWCSWKAFHPNEPDEGYEGFAWYTNIQAAPLYREELDIVAVSGDDEIVSFCTVWYDPATNTAYFEPVGTHPQHQKKGLGKACITEGLRLLKKLGCVRAFVGGHSNAANALYNSAGFKDFDVSEPWEKIFD